MLAIQTFRRVCIADIATGPIAVQAPAVVPAACILIQIAAQSTHVANLGTGNYSSSLRQHPITFPDDRILGDLSERRDCANLNAISGLPNAFPGIDLSQFDHGAGRLVAVL